MTKRKSSADHIEAAIASLLKAGDRKLLDHATWLAHHLPARKEARALKTITAAVIKHRASKPAVRWAAEVRAH
jgi:hypothetical protein